MSNNALKDLFIFTKAEREKIIIVSASIFLFVICIFISQWLIPEHCYLFSNNIESGFACDGIDLLNPRPCPTCDNKQKAIVASIIAGLGIAFLFFPFVFFILKRWRKDSIDQAKLFD